MASRRLLELASRPESLGPEQRAELAVLLEMRMKLDSPLLRGLPEQVLILGLLDSRAL